MNLKDKPLKQPTILLLENDVNHTNTFLQLAELNGWVVFTCLGSMEAIRWLKSNNAPNLMILEKDASPLNGFQTQDYIKSELKIDIPVLISSQINSRAENNNNNNNKLISFIKKPFSEQSVAVIKSKLTIENNSKGSDVKAYSLNYLKGLSGDDEEFILTSLNIFRDSVAAKLIEIKDAVVNNEFKVVRDIAHNIKPSFEMLESTAGSDICNTLVYKSSDNEIKGLVEQLRQIFAIIDLQLKNDVPKLAEA